MELNNCADDSSAEQQWRPLHAVFNPGAWFSYSSNQKCLVFFFLMSHKSKEIMKRAFRTKYESVFKQMNKSEIAERKKLRTFFLVKKSFKQEGYLTSVKSVKYRRAFTKMRLSDHCLPIEKLRKSNVPEERRFCTLCHSNRIGNEEHIFNCTNPVVVSLRNAFLSASISLVPQLDHLSLPDKFIYILSGCDESIIELTCKFFSDYFDLVK